VWGKGKKKKKKKRGGKPLAVLSPLLYGRKKKKEKGEIKIAVILGRETG